MNKQKLQGWTKHLDFIIIDMLCLGLSFYLGFSIRHRSFGLAGPRLPLYRMMFLVLLLINAAVVGLSDSFKNVLKRGYYQEFLSVLKHGFLVMITSTLYLFYGQVGQDFSRLTLFYTFLIYMPLTFAVRLFWKSVLGRRRKKTVSMLIVTSFGNLQELWDKVCCKPYLNEYSYAGIYFLDKQVGTVAFHGIPVIKSEEEFRNRLIKEWIDEVLFYIPEGMELPLGMIEEAMEMGIVVHINMMRLAGLEGIQGSSREIGQLGEETVLTAGIREVGSFSIIVKRIMDIAGGLIGCAVTGVLFVILAPLIYINSPGPVFFSQERVGRNGKRFRMYKFRSMYPDAEKRKAELEEENRVKDGMMFKLDFDPRIIGAKRLPDGTVKKGIGNIMRDYSLDEFPQFFNVLKGDMSLVGTRPPTIDEWEKYKPYHRSRLAVKPGITGLWQVSGRSRITDFDEVVKLDRKYIMNWNLGLDIKILFRTLVVVFRREGAM